MLFDYTVYQMSISWYFVKLAWTFLTSRLYHWSCSVNKISNSLETNLFCNIWAYTSWSHNIAPCTHTHGLDGYTHTNFSDEILLTVVSRKLKLRKFVSQKFRWFEEFFELTRILRLIRSKKWVHIASKLSRAHFMYIDLRIRTHEHKLNHLNAYTECSPHFGIMVIITKWVNI